MQINDMALSSKNLNTNDFSKYSREELIVDMYEYEGEAVQVRDYYIFTSLFTELYLLEKYYGYFNNELSICFRIYKGTVKEELELIGWSIYEDDVLPDDLPQNLLNKITTLENEFEEQKEAIKND